MKAVIEIALDEHAYDQTVDDQTLARRILSLLWQTQGRYLQLGDIFYVRDDSGNAVGDMKVVDGSYEGTH